jgi:hypothetical protein
MLASPARQTIALVDSCGEPIVLEVDAIYRDPLAT